ncbi:MAG: Type fimbrial biosis protein PilY1, partial [Labilithrix sp.]|nr:Type fimbrial biosis protein PilY1 [Labilithrix sp.]
RSPTTENLRAVWGSGPNDVWAVGELATIVHWDGQSWTLATSALPLGTKPDLNGIWGSGPEDVWAVGKGTALHFTGKKPTAAGNP